MISLPWLLALTFGATLVAVTALLYVVTAQQRAIGRRIAALAEPPAGPTPRATGPQDSFPTVTRLLGAWGKLEPMRLALVRSGLALKPGEFVGLVALVAALLGVAFWFLTHQAIYVLVALLLPVVGSRLLLSVLQRNRMALFERQLADALGLMASSLRSGYSISRAIQTVGSEMPPPIGTEFRQVAEEVGLGLPLEDALRHLSSRIPSYDLELMVTAIVIQMEVGGNLAAILETLASTIRERLRIKAEISALTAEGRMSGAILLALPFIMAGLMLLLNRPYFVPLITTAMGIWMIVFALLLQAIGLVWIWRLLEVDF